MPTTDTFTGLRADILRRPVMLFRRAVQFETPSTGLVAYAPGDTITITDADLRETATVSEVARLCAYTAAHGPDSARATLYKDTKAAAKVAEELRARQAEADAKHEADVALAAGWMTRGGRADADTAALDAENAALRETITAQAAEHTAALAALTERIAALEGKRK